MHVAFQSYKAKDLKRDKFFDTIVLLSEKELNKYQKYFKNMNIIPNFTNIHSKQKNHSQKVVLSVGTISCEKGVLDFLIFGKKYSKIQKITYGNFV